MSPRAALLAGLAALALAGAAKPPELDGRVEAERPAGCHDYGVLLWDLYRAELWTDTEAPRAGGFALTLTYRDSFSRDDLVKASIEEMARISGQPEARFAGVRRQLADAFRDVAEGDRVTAWRAGPERLAFFVNGSATGTLTRHVELFLDIWLGAEARDAAGRRALLDGRCDG